MLQARGKPGVAGVDGNRVTVMARKRHSSRVLLGANRIIRHVRSGVRRRDPAGRPHQGRAGVRDRARRQRDHAAELDREVLDRKQLRRGRAQPEAAGVGRLPSWG